MSKPAWWHDGSNLRLEETTLEQNKRLRLVLMDKLAKRDANILVTLFNCVIAGFYQVIVKVLVRDQHDHELHWKFVQELPV